MNVVLSQEEIDELKEQLSRAEIDCANLTRAINEHRLQKADDRCIEDDDKLYAAAGLPPCDRRVGSQEEMLKNCARFIMNRCQGGGWPSYAKLHAALTRISNSNIVFIREIAQEALRPE